ncbi:PG0870-related protein, partial [Proteiniphilum sp. UBA5375]|uniref:PG0870-related protein n=1 Tax=Proteiniphilum sp. UBA5375 TaxID=1947278 RepID=UPI00257E89B4
KGKSTRHTCPACKDTYSFTLYLDGNTAQPIHLTVGKCNHENKCGYHYTPRQYFNDHPEKKNKQPQNRPTKSRSSQPLSTEYWPSGQYSSLQKSTEQISPELCLPQPITPQHQSAQYSLKKKALQNPASEINHIPYMYVKRSASYKSNFVRFLCNYFSKDKIETAVEDYALGATKNKQ